MARRLTPRRVLIWAHRWVGLTVGLVFTIVSISGTALLFQSQYWEWAHGELTPPGMSGDIGSIDTWVENARAAVPGLGEPVAVWPPHVEHNLSDAGMLIFGGREPGGLGNMGFAAVLVAPATGEVLGVVDVDRSPAYAPLFLHRDLWAGETGRVVSGIIAIGSVFLLLAGLYLWWPSGARLSRKLLGRPWRITLTRSRPMHDWVGVWTCAALLVLTATGLALVRPAWVEPAIEAAVGPDEIVAAVAQPCASPMTFDAAIARARELFPEGTFKSLYPADEEFRRWEIALAGAGSSAMHRETHVVADLQCGTVTLEATAESRPAAEALAMWMMDVHDGTAFGSLGPALVGLFGLAPLVLMWTGVRMWARGRGWLTAGTRAAGAKLGGSPLVAAAERNQAPRRRAG